MGKKPTTEAGKLAIVACHFNPAGFAAPVGNVEKFLRGLEAQGIGSSAFVGVCSFGDSSIPGILWSSDGAKPICFKSDSILWQKEALLNAVVAQLPPEYTKVAVVDADVLFPDGWYAATSAALDESPVIQPWSRVTVQGDEACRASVASGAVRGPSPRLANWRCYHPGYAWAMRRDFFTSGPGLYQNAVVGFADGFLALALTSPRQAMLDHPQFHALPEAVQKDVLAWADKVIAWQNGRPVGAVKCDIEALPHGSREDRKYYDRLALLTDFNPAKDLAKQTAPGPLEWSESAREDKPAMIEAVAGYFAGRNEDGAAKLDLEAMEP